MENIIAHAHELKGKQRENIENFAQQGLVSKKLATIILNVPIAFDEASLVLEEPSRELLEPLFAELEFRTIGKRVFGEDFSVNESKSIASQQQDLFGNNVPLKDFSNAQPSLFDTPIDAKNITNTPHEYFLVDTEEERKSLIATLLIQDRISFDTETTGTDANLADLVGLSFSIKPGEGYYIPLSEDRAITDLR